MLAVPVPLDPPVGSPTRAVVPAPERETEVPNAAGVLGTDSNADCAHAPLVNVSTVAAPVPAVASGGIADERRGAGAGERY